MRKNREKTCYRSMHAQNSVFVILLAVITASALMLSGCADKKKHALEQTTSCTSFRNEPPPAYSGAPYVEINSDTPFFTNREIHAVSYLEYASLDDLGRCGQASACLSPETVVPQGTERGPIGHIRPSGWHTVKYDCIYQKYLYNRCHMIAWSLSGTLDDPRNLITGTKYMNLSMLNGMEYETLNYIRKTGNHVMYRVTPVFDGNELVCRGLLMETRSVEDNGAGLTHCRFFYNVQPGISINYADGTSEYNGIFHDTRSPAVNAE